MSVAIVHSRALVGVHAPCVAVEVHVAGAHHGGGITVVEECEEQVLEGCVFVVAFVCEGQRLVKRAFQALGESRH